MVSSGEFVDKDKFHVHDPEAEGPLPSGFLNTGREGKVRNIYESVDGNYIGLLASDRVSAFDQVSPTLVPGKGEVLNDIARYEFEAAKAAGIPTWFEYTPGDNPRLAIGKKAEILPVEMIFRNYMTGSMWREYKKTGDFAGMGLPSGWQEWQDFSDNPLFTPSTKSDKDVNFNPKDVKKMTGVDEDTLGEMEAICRELFKLGTERAARKGLVLIDTKYEIGRLSDGTLVVCDEIHTPDSSRFVYADSFKKAVAAGEKPMSLSKEFLREVMLGLVDSDDDEEKVRVAKELMKEPLPPEVVTELMYRYQQLREVFIG